MTPAPSPLDLARMHEKEFKTHVEGAIMMRRLIEQIMVGRVIIVPKFDDRRCTVTRIKVVNATVYLFGKVRGHRGIKALCAGLDFVHLVQPETTT